MEIGPLGEGVEPLEGVQEEEEEEEEEEGEEDIQWSIANTSLVHPSPMPPLATPPSNGVCQNGLVSPIQLLRSTASLVDARRSKALSVLSLPTIQACNRSAGGGGYEGGIFGGS